MRGLLIWAFIGIYCMSCKTQSADDISAISYDWTPLEMVASGSNCVEYYNNGEKYRIDCYYENDTTMLETFIEFNRNGKVLKSILYRPSITEDTILLEVNGKENCLISKNKYWQVCYDSAWKNVKATYLYDNYYMDYTPLPNFRKYQYNEQGLVKATLLLEGEIDLALKKTYFNYTKFDQQGNWVEREVYSDFEYIDDDEGFKVNQLTEDERNKLFNTFPSSPEELNDKEPFIQTRTIIYE
ncbi:hypothetical protein [Fulvivirga kasyanovii]|uniref:hypothetical protein n=1 Tax=Fulvivirga kasyanovii TaxID=396812 RepID=UPI0031D73ED8